jgi:hypothetical protein
MDGWIEWMDGKKSSLLNEREIGFGCVVICWAVLGIVFVFWLSLLSSSPFFFRPVLVVIVLLLLFDATLMLGLR